MSLANLKENRLSNIQLLAKQAVEGFIIGLHKSPFHGFSVEFAEHRLYNTGDNLKHIDWKVFARSNKLFIKKYEEETNLRCTILMDISASMNFPEQVLHYNKLQFSAIASAAILHLLKQQLDAASLVLFEDEIKLKTPCKSNSVHFNNLYSELEKLLNYKPQKTKTNIPKILHQIADNIHKRSLVIIFSDMLDKYGEMDDIFSALQHLKYNKHEVILFNVLDFEKELNFEFENRPYEFVDLETGENIKINTTATKEVYTAQIQKFRKDLLLKCAQYGIDVVDADINKSFNQILMPYFLKREKLN